MEGNREYKSDVFSMLMAEKENALQVYNALNKTDYRDAEQIEIYTLETGVSLSIRNDAAFIIDSRLSIYEHQSTVCPNIPLRNLFYVTSILKNLVKKKRLYSSVLVTIPEPQFVVFYNGKQKAPEKEVLRLSDAFEKGVGQEKDAQLELVCTVYNINKGNNKTLLENCHILADYMTFVDYVRMYEREYAEGNLREAVNAAIERCISENVLVEFFKKHREEVIKIMELDYTFERQIELEREASLEEGITIGRTEGINIGRREGINIGRREGIMAGRTEELIALVREGVLLVADAAKRIGITEEEFKKLI